MKKLLSLMFVAVLAVSTLAGCGTSGSELALVTDVGTIDDKSFNQGAWEGLVAYAEANDVSHKYYQPTEKSTDAYVAAIDLAVEGGAKTIVTPGFLFENAVWLAQTKYPEVNFILLDGAPHNVADWGTMDTVDGTEVDFTTADNTLSIFYAEHESGFLAGYAAVKEGYRTLGFMGGMAVPAVIRFGYGFVEGANYAAAELGVDVVVDYHYTGTFGPSDEVQTKASDWFNNGVEVIFAAAGGAGNSVMKAAEQTGGKVIGVDVNQMPESDTVITSAMKGLGASVEQALTDTWAGGQSIVKDASNNGVALPTDFSRFSNFTEADYNAAFDMLAAGEYNFIQDYTVELMDLYSNLSNTTVNAK
jgi:basic membrane protein A